MFASISTGKLKPGTSAEFARAWKENSLRMATEAEGFKQAYCLTNSQTNEVTIVGIWESEADARAFATSGPFQQAQATLAAYFAELPTLKVYEVSAQS